MLPPIFVITTTHTPNRTAAAEAHLQEMGIPYKVWTGMHGESIGLASSYIAGESDPEGVPPGWTPSGSNMSLTCNHWGVLASAAVMLEGDEFIVLEDDVVCVPNFMDEWEKSYAALPADWEMVYLSDLWTDRLPKRVINDRVIQASYPILTHAIMYKRSVVKKLLYGIAQDKWNIGIDLLYERRIFRAEKIRPYSFSPSLITQRTLNKEWTCSLYTGDDIT